MDRPTVGYSGGHGETVLVLGPNGTFWREDRVLSILLADEGFDLVPVRAPIAPQGLDGLSGLILGAPARRLDRVEFAAVARFVEAGGGLLAVPHREEPDWRFRPSSRWLFGLNRVGLAHPFLAGVEMVRAHKKGDHFDRHQSDDILYRAPGAADGDRGVEVLRVEHGRGVALLLGTGGRLDAPWVADHLLDWMPALMGREIAERMAKPQRHRLLHAYPMRGQMESVREPSGSTRRDLHLSGLDPDRSLLVGTLPHPFCNPTVQGCGFCTFPHQRKGAKKTAEVVAAVVHEIAHARGILEKNGQVGRPVDALYFGGATANLTPPEPFADLCGALRETFDLSGAEISLEGVPAYFLRGEPRLLDVLRRELPARHYRLSMGVQTFDPDRLAAMGRSHFGDASTFRQVVDYAHAEGATISGDFLFDLPGQTLDQMRDDVDRAVDLGLDQVCLYHLVMFDGLNVEWAKDPELLASLPSNPVGAANWIDLRERLIGLGYVQTTLTNFERADLVGTSRGYLYEPKAKCPETHDLLGFGPAGLSITARRNWPGASRKACNPERADRYQEAVDRSTAPAELVFHYEQTDTKVLHLTRKVAALGIDRAAYRDRFGNDPLDDFPREFAALIDAGLIAPSAVRLDVTPLGMFYADTIAGLLAWRRTRHWRNTKLAKREMVRQMRERDRSRGSDAGHYRMG